MRQTTTATQTNLISFLCEVRLLFSLMVCHIQRQDGRSPLPKT